jgi:hypothetical protein
VDRYKIDLTAPKLIKTERALGYVFDAPVQTF